MPVLVYVFENALKCMYTFFQAKISRYSLKKQKRCVGISVGTVRGWYKCSILFIKRIFISTQKVIGGGGGEITALSPLKQNVLPNDGYHKVPQISLDGISHSVYVTHLIIPEQNFVCITLITLELKVANKVAILGTLTYLKVCSVALLTV